MRFRLKTTNSTISKAAAEAGYSYYYSVIMGHSCSRIGGVMLYKSEILLRSLHLINLVLHLRSAMILFTISLAVILLSKIISIESIMQQNYNHDCIYSVCNDAKNNQYNPYLV